MSFVSYTAHVFIPFLAAAVLVYPILAFVLFRKRGLIPATLGLELSDRDSNAAASGTLVDKHGAIFGSILLLVTLAVLVGTSTIGVPVWEVTVPPALIMLLRDSLHDWREKNKNGLGPPSTETSASPRNTPEDIPMSSLRESNGTLDRQLKARSDTESRTEVEVGPPSSAAGSIVNISRDDNPSDAPTRSSSPVPPETLYDCIARKLGVIRETFPTVTTIALRLPVPLLPFAFLMFILVQALSSQGWVEVLARWWAAWVARTGTLGAVGGMGFIACIFCNVSRFFAPSLQTPHLLLRLCSGMWHEHRCYHPPRSRASRLA